MGQFLWHTDTHNYRPWERERPVITTQGFSEGNSCYVKEKTCYQKWRRQLHLLSNYYEPDTAGSTVFFPLIFTWGVRTIPVLQMRRWRQKEVGSLRQVTEGRPGEGTQTGWPWGSCSKLFVSCFSQTWQWTGKKKICLWSQNRHGPAQGACSVHGVTTGHLKRDNRHKRKYLHVCYHTGNHLHLWDTPGKSLTFLRYLWLNKLYSELSPLSHPSWKAEVLAFSQE